VLADAVDYSTGVVVAPRSQAYVEKRTIG